MTDPDPYEQVIAAWADVSERMVAYADVWRSAIQRNAAGTYAADDLLVDMQALWGMSIRDTARAGASLVEAMAPLLDTAGFAADGGSDDEDGDDPPED